MTNTMREDVAAAKDAVVDAKARATHAHERLAKAARHTALTTAEAEVARLEREQVTGALQQVNAVQEAMHPPAPKRSRDKKGWTGIDARGNPAPEPRTVKLNPEALRRELAAGEW